MRPAPALLLLLGIGCGATAGVELPGGKPGVGFDDLRFSPRLGRALVPAGRSGRLDLVDLSSGTVSASIGGFSAEDDFGGGHDFGVTSVDDTGKWLYATGLPAKSGVGGGILAALPARLGLGSYSPKLDKHGNSVRGIKVCEALSSHYDLHMLNRSDDARNSIIADYNIGNSPSRRVRRTHEQNILAAHHQDVRIIELMGTLSFSNVDYVSRQLAAKPRPQLVIFDLRRVTAMTRAGAHGIAMIRGSWR